MSSPAFPHDPAPAPAGARRRPPRARPPPRSARGILRDVFGFHEYRPDQEAIVDHLVAGGDAFVLMPTGGGKSLCYQIPSLLRPGTGIIVSPLISLMKDQVDALRAAGVRAAAYNSSLDGGEARGILRDLHRGELDLLYVAPETLMTESFLDRLQDIAADAALPAAVRAAARPPATLAAAPAASPSSPSTRRTASASGATTSAPSTSSSVSCGACSPACR